jgi:hypothetical protein
MNAKSRGTQTILEEKLKGTEKEFWITPAYSDFDQLLGVELAVEYAGGIDADGEGYLTRVVREKLIPVSETPAQWKGDQVQHVYGYLAADRRTFTIAGHGFADWEAEEHRIIRKIERSGWLGDELNDKPCTYGIPKDTEGDPRDTKACGKPSVYKAVGGSEYCAEHAPEVAANDEIYLPQEED